MRDVRLASGSCTNGSAVRLWCGSLSAVCVISGDTQLNHSAQTTDVNPSRTYNLWLGLSLAVLSAFLIGCSVILKKKALLRLAGTGDVRAGFLVYAALVLLLCAVLVLHLSPRCGRTNILVYIGVCSLLGAFTVSSVKGLAIVIDGLFSDASVLAKPLTWILLLTLIISIVTQVNYLNKSLDTFNTLLVYPIYYVLFTSVVLSTSIILFQEWRSMTAVGVVTTLGSFLVIVVGVAMLHLFRELQITLKQLTNQLSQSVEGEGLTEEEEEPSERAEGGRKERRGGNKKEDKCGLMDNMAIESLAPVREEGPRVFIIS